MRPVKTHIGRRGGIQPPHFSLYPEQFRIRESRIRQETCICTRRDNHSVLHQFLPGRQDELAVFQIAVRIPQSFGYFCDSPSRVLQTEHLLPVQIFGEPNGDSVRS